MEETSGIKCQTRILTFINKATIYWYSKLQATVVARTFGAEFYTVNMAVEMIESLRYELKMFGNPVDDPANNP